MKKNVGNIDRAARIVFGIAIIAAGIYAGSWFGLFGLVPLATAFARRCPGYLPFGINTCKADECANPKDAHLGA